MKDLLGGVGGVAVAITAHEDSLQSSQVHSYHI